MIRIGKVARPHGVRGAIAVTLEDPASESLFGVAYVHLAAPGEEPRRFDAQRTARGRPGQVLLFLSEIGTVEAAESLRGQAVLLEEGQLPALGEDEYWHRDLLGLSAVTGDDLELGEVAEVVDTAEVPVLVIRRGKGETYVPFNKAHVLAVDLSRKRVVVEPPAEGGE